MKKKTRGKGKTTPMKRANLRFTGTQLRWLADHTHEKSDLVRTAVDILKNWFEVDEITGNVTPKIVILRQFSDRVIRKEWKRRFGDED